MLPIFKVSQTISHFAPLLGRVSPKISHVFPILSFANPVILSKKYGIKYSPCQCLKPSTKKLVKPLASDKLKY
jgi:hypothetical protein